MNGKEALAGCQGPLDYALWYARQGWPVFPMHSLRDGRCTCRHGSKCDCPGKHPRTRHGRNNATTDERTIWRWWSPTFGRWPDANIAVITGTGSGLVVLDVDRGKGGLESLAAAQRDLGELPL